MKVRQVLKGTVASIAVGAAVVTTTIAVQQQPTHPVVAQASSYRALGKSWRGRYMSNSVKMTVTAHYVKIDTDLAHVGTYKKVKNGWYRISFTNFKPLYMKYSKSDRVMAIRYKAAGPSYYFFKQ